MNALGYLSKQYAAALAEFGTPRYLENCGGWILERFIRGTSEKDAMGCYPLFSCKDWSLLTYDIKELEKDLISLSLVTDPFNSFEIKELKAMFDVCYLYKYHYFADLSHEIEDIVNKRNQKYARKALKIIEVEYSKQPGDYLQDWLHLYDLLIDRHKITGLQAFSRKYFETLFSMTGVEMFIARYQQKIIGADIWIIDNDIGYAHLAALDPVGYELRAAYALLWAAYSHYSKNLRWLHLGGGAGSNLGNPESDGLSVFKRGWTNHIRPVFFCGKILNHKIYQEFTTKKTEEKSNYFPAYRTEEF